MMNQEKTVRMLQLAAVVLLAGLSFLVADAHRERLVNVGDTAPSFHVKTENGKTLTRSDFGGKVLVLNFWATWCPPCVEEMPSLKVMAERLAPKGVVVLGVSVDENEGAYRRFLQQNRLTFETARDPESMISVEYGTFKYPETYVIGQDGKVRQKHIGPRDWTDPELMKSIEQLL
jgi:peroxiredoxin